MNAFYIMIRKKKKKKTFIDDKNNNFKTKPQTLSAIIQSKQIHSNKSSHHRHHI